MLEYRLMKKKHQINSVCCCTCVYIFYKVIIFSVSADGETVFKPYNFKMDEIDGFKYRAKVCNKF